MAGTEVREAAASFVHRLDLTERHVLMLHYAEQLTPEEISLVLDLPEPAVHETIDDLKSRARTAIGSTVPRPMA